MDLSNVKRLHEDKVLSMLESLYDQGKQDSPEYKILETELEDRAKRSIITNQSNKESAENRRIKAVEDRMTAKYGADWFTWAKSLYTIDDNYTVTSAARDWEEPKEWACGCKSEAMEKIEQLIFYKEYDRNRGHGDMDKDLEEYNKDANENIPDSV
jgi:hypothetical protein